MTRIKLPYIHEFTARHGEVRRYFRRFGKRIPLPGLPGSEEFMAAYQNAMAHKPIGDHRTKPGTVSAAIAGYYTSLAFRSLAPNTQQMRRAIYERFRNQHGHKQIKTLPQAFIVSQLNKMGPFAARSWLKALRALAQFCLTEGLITADPTLGRLPSTKSAGHHTWTEAEITQFEEMPSERQQGAAGVCAAALHRPATQ